MTGEIDRTRAQRLMGEDGIDALVLAAPEAFRTVTGAPPGVPSAFRRAGAALAVLPADADAPLGAVITDLAAAGPRALGIDTRSHPAWVEVLALSEGPLATAMAEATRGRPADFARPATFDRAAAFALLADLLNERGLAGGRIGLDLDFWPAADFAALRAQCPSIAFCDASLTFDRVRAVKPPHVIAALTLAAELAEAGVTLALESLREGLTRGEIAAVWSEGVDEEARRRGLEPPQRAEWIAFGDRPWQSGGTLHKGDIVKFDVSCAIEGNASDSARTVAFGTAPARSREIHDALLAGFLEGRNRLRAGVPVREVFDATTKAVRGAGLHGWTRGHVGHGLGRGVFGEMWPFLSCGTDDVLEENMVVAFETPFYADGEGGFIIEDQFVITADGAQAAWTLPHALRTI